MNKPDSDADIVERLRYSGSLSEIAGATLEDEAAAEIERLRAALNGLMDAKAIKDRNGKTAEYLAKQQAAWAAARAAVNLPAR